MRRGRSMTTRRRATKMRDDVDEIDGVLLVLVRPMAGRTTNCKLP